MRNQLGRRVAPIRLLIGLIFAGLSMSAFIQLGDYAEWPGMHSGTYPASFRESYERAFSDPNREEEYLRASLRRNPRFMDAAIALSALLEQRGEVTQAETELLSLSSRDRRFRPRWAILNFYARQNRSADFWLVSATAIPMSFGDHRPLLELLWQMRPDAPYLDTHLEPSARAPLLFEFVALLMEKGELDVARRVFARLLRMPVDPTQRANAGIVATAEERRQRGLDLCDLHLDHALGKGAWEIWQALVAAGLLRGDLAPLDRNVNPAFASKPIARGFDWRPQTVHGIEQSRSDSGWQIELSGYQPDFAVLLTRWSWLERPGWTWKAQMDSQPDVHFESPGLEWRITGPKGESSAQHGLVRLSLVYRRPPGTLPRQGRVIVRHAAWESVR